MELLPLYLSAKLAFIATLILIGIAAPLAYLLTNFSWRGKSLVEALVNLPIALPPTVIGFYLLFLLGPRGVVGEGWERLFGGPLLLCPSFRGYDGEFAQDIVKNIAWGMEAKNTKTIFLYFHFPCGVARKFGHSIEEVVKMAAEAKTAIAGLKPKKVFIFFQVKRINKGGQEEQNTYRLRLSRTRKL